MKKRHSFLVITTIQILFEAKLTIEHLYLMDWSQFQEEKVKPISPSPGLMHLHCGDRALCESYKEDERWKLGKVATLNKVREWGLADRCVGGGEGKEVPINCQTHSPQAGQIESWNVLPILPVLDHSIRGDNCFVNPLWTGLGECPDWRWFELKKFPSKNKLL